MYAILVGLAGVVAFGMGVAAIVFLGLPVKEFSLGNTYILAGAIVLAAGLVLIGLSLPVWYLQRIADALAPARGRARLSGDPTAVAAGRTAAPAAPPSRVPFPPRPPEGGPGRGPEPRIPPPVDISREMSAERPRPRIPPIGPGPGEPQVVEENDEVTLSPRAPMRPVPFPPRVPSDMPLEPKVGPGLPARPNGSAPAETLPPAERPWPPGPAPERPSPGALLDSFWPARQDKTAAGAPESRQNPPPQGSTNDTVAREDKKAEGAERRAVSILKSGVVDGMAYTLYTDGSIEAELPEGTVRFGSIGELREHLERHPG